MVVSVVVNICVVASCDVVGSCVVMCMRVVSGCVVAGCGAVLCITVVVGPSVVGAIVIVKAREDERRGKKRKEFS